MESQQKIARIILYVTALGAIVLGAVLLGTAAIPFDWIKPQIDALSVDGDAEKFTREAFDRITRRTLLGGVVLLGIGGIALWQRSLLLRQLELLTSQLVQSNRDFWMDLRRIVRDLGEQNKIHLVLLSVFLITGIAFRIAFLFQPIRHDEAFTYTNYASKPLLLALSNYSFPNNHLFHTLLVNLSCGLFGNQLWAIRLPALLAGIAILPLSYLLVRALYNRHAALIALGLTACASANIEYATNARGYTLITACFLSISLLAIYLRQKNNLSAWILFGVICALGFYTIPIMLYPFAGVMLWIAASIGIGDFSVAGRRGIGALLRVCIIAITCTGAFYTPMMLGSGLEALIGNRFVQSATFSAFVFGLPDRLEEVWQQGMRDLPAALTWVLGLLALLGVLAERRLSPRKIPFTATIALGLLICLCLQRVLPPARVWLYLLPLFFGVLGFGITVCLQNALSQNAQCLIHLAIAIALTTCCGFGAYQTLTQYYPYGPGTMRDAESITQDLSDQLQPGDRLLTIATAAPLEYYFQKHRVPIAYLRRPLRESSRVILVVLENKYTLDQVLNFVKWPKPFGPPRLLKAYPSARLYVLEASQRSAQ